MKKKFTILTALLSLSFATSAVAEDLVIKINYKSGVEIVGAQFNRLLLCIDNVNTETFYASLGEVDFGEDGSKYAAVGIDFARGWSGDGYAILHAGTTYEDAKPFAYIFLGDTQGYSRYFTFTDTVTAKKQAPLPERLAALEGIEFVQPKGKQNVFLSLFDGSGNIKAVRFYEKLFSAEDIMARKTTIGSMAVACAGPI